LEKEVLLELLEVLLELLEVLLDEDPSELSRLVSES